MLSSLVLATSLIAQCPGGSCAVRLPNYQPFASPSLQAAPATTYRLSDATGQVWTHADPVWLQAYVSQVNARSRPVYAAPMFRSPCAGGVCPR